MLNFFKVKIQNFSTLILMIIHVTEYALRIHVCIKHAFCSLMQLASILFACVYICMCADGEGEDPAQPVIVQKVRTSTQKSKHTLQCFWFCDV